MVRIDTTEERKANWFLLQGTLDPLDAQVESARQDGCSIDSVQRVANVQSLAPFELTMACTVGLIELIELSEDPGGGGGGGEERNDKSASTRKPRRQRHLPCISPPATTGSAVVS